MLDDIVLVTSCADVENRTDVFDDFRRHVSVSFVTSRTLHKDLRHWRRRNFVRHFSFDGWHFLYYIANEKGILSPVRQIKRMSTISSMLSASAISLHSLVRKRAQTMHLDVVISLYRNVYLHTSSGNRIAFFLLHRFLLIPVREMIAKTLMCITFFLSLCICRRLRWKNSVTTVAFSFCAFGMKKTSLIW